MSLKKPCLICRKWFLPNPRVGVRQQVCSEKSCQKERHRRNCEKWRDQNPDYDRENRVRKKLIQDSTPTSSKKTKDPLRRINLPAARKAVGLEIMIIMEETAKDAVSIARDLVRAQAPVSKEKYGKHGHLLPRDSVRAQTLVSKE